MLLYLCLEDSERRIQERLNTITDNVPEGMYFATGCTSIESGVCDWLRRFKGQHPVLSLVAIDTFQLIRTPTPEVSYGGDYAELRILRELADELGICLLLVHHLRKMNDRDPVNKLSGSTGISGAVDAIFVLDKSERIERLATFYASGRDIRDRNIQLELDKDTCVWTLIADSLTMPETMLPDEMAYVFGFVWRSKNHEFVGTNTGLAQHVSIRRAMPIPLRRRRNFFCPQKKSHSGDSRYFTLPQGNISHSARGIFHYYRKDFTL